jgi:putative transcriptional regulator
MFFDTLGFGQSLLKNLKQFFKPENSLHKRPHGHLKEEGDIPLYTSVEIVKVRKKYKLTQKSLAAALNVSRRTVEAWEAGKNTPVGPARKLLYLLDTDRDNIIISRLQDANT